MIKPIQAYSTTKGIALSHPFEVDAAHAQHPKHRCTGLVVILWSTPVLNHYVLKAAVTDASQSLCRGSRFFFRGPTKGLSQKNVGCRQSVRPCRN